MEIDVKCFAAAREAVGAREIVLDVPEGTTVGVFREVLLATHPALQSLNLQFAVNMVYVVGARRAEATVSTGTAAPVTWETVLQAGDVVACIPPVGGG